MSHRENATLTDRIKVTAEDVARAREKFEGLFRDSRSAILVGYLRGLVDIATRGDRIQDATWAMVAAHLQVHDEMSRQPVLAPEQPNGDAR